MDDIQSTEEHTLGMVIMHTQEYPMKLNALGIKSVHTFHCCGQKISTSESKVMVLTHKKGVWCSLQVRVAVLALVDELKNLEILFTRDWKATCATDKRIDQIGSCVRVTISDCGGEAGVTSVNKIYITIFTYDHWPQKCDQVVNCFFGNDTLV